MKAILLNLALITLLLGVAGCTPNQIREVTAQDNGGTVELKTGDTLVVTLAGNITTGYQWEVLPNPDGVLVLQGEPEYVPESAGKLMGAGGVYHFRFTTVKAGTTQVALKYYRSFEPADVAPVETFEIDVVVK